MTMISLIAAMDENQALGKENQLLCHLPADLQHFKQLTLAKPLIMGRRTHESIGRVLPQRLNLVLSRKVSLLEAKQENSDLEWFPSLETALARVVTFPEVMVIGGEALFKESLPLAATLYLTKIHHCFEKADVFFPPFDAKQWVCESSCFRPKDEKNPYDLTFYHYRRKGKS